MIRQVIRRTIDKVEQGRNHSYMRGTVGASSHAAWLASGVTCLLATAALVGVVGIAAPAFAQVSGQTPAVSPNTLTPERITASTAAIVGLIGAMIGGMALARSLGRIGAGHGRRGAIVALVMGPIGLIIGGLVVATADGGLGTGNGIAGGVVAMILGLIGVALGGLALSRSRRIA